MKRRIRMWERAALFLAWPFLATVCMFVIAVVLLTLWPTVLWADIDIKRGASTL